MAETTEPFKLKQRHLSAVIRLLQGHLDPDADGESEVNLTDKAKDNLSLCSRVLNSGVDGKAAKDTDPVLDPLETKLKGGTVRPGTQEVARGADKRASDAILARARDSRANGPTSPFAGCGDYTPDRVALAKDGSVLRIDSFFGQSADKAGDATIDSIFTQPPTLANG
jgi:hypothetical protein